jgi:hypothetical protein
LRWSIGAFQARAYGIHTGMRLKLARQLCPDLIQAVSHPQRFLQFHWTGQGAGMYGSQHWYRKRENNWIFLQKKIFIDSKST